MSQSGQVRLPVRMQVIGSDAAQVAALQSVLVAQVPGVAVSAFDPTWVRSAPDAEAVVVDGLTGSTSAADMARQLRAMGYKGAIALVVADGVTLDEVVLRFDAVVVPESLVPTELVPDLATQMMRLEVPGTEMMMRARRITAAGELALRLQHALNNPLAGLMAEVQLLQMEELGEQHNETLARMLGLCRRMVEITRSLDGVGERKSKG
jgi:signal transduction histidine kinase